MNEPIKKMIPNPESYSPKDKPEIINMVENSNKLISSKDINPHYTIEGVFPTDNNPWVGGCNYLRCFISLQMHIDQIPHDKQENMRYELYRKYFATTGMGLSTIWQLSDRWENYSFEAIPNYTHKTFRYVGYDYIEIDCKNWNEKDLYNLINLSISNNKPVLAAYGYNSIDNTPSRFNRLWRLFIGYDLYNNSVMVNEDGETKELIDWNEGLESIIIITQTGLNKPDIKDVFTKTIYDLEKLSLNGVPYGHAAYEECAAFLSDSHYFESANDDELDNIQKSLSAFFWYHAETRGATGEGFDTLCLQELNKSEYATDVGCNGFWGYNGHQVSYIGCMALRKGSAALRDKPHRDVLIYALRMLMSNDAKIIKMIKQAFSITTPDVLSPKDEDGQPIDYCQRSKAMLTWKSKNLFENKFILKMTSLTAKTILSECKPVKVYQIDFNKDIDAVDTVLEITKEGLLLKNSGSEWDMTGRIITKQTYCAPLIINACIDNKETTPFGLFFGNGFTKCSNWADLSGQFIINDFYMNYAMDFWAGQPLPQITTEEINISCIIQRNYMAIIVNGELVHYIENLPYMHFELLQSPVGFGAFKDQPVLIKSLQIAELS